jgi:DNA-binding SARP family transcriptional activator
MTTMLHIHLLGDFRLVYGDTPVIAINTLRLQSLLAYLVLHRYAPQSRSHLAFLLWPDSTEAQARTNLRHQFHLLRQALPEADRFLYADAQTLQWQSDAPSTLDVADFESRVAQVTSVKALQEAVELYFGDLLPSCYDDWILPERERLHQTFIEALERLIGRLEDERDYPTAISNAQRLLRYDPLHEETYRHLMRLYALSGDRASALRVYHICTTILQRELAVESSPATREVYERLLNVAAPSVSPAVSSSVLKALSPLVGRQQEWTQLQAAWRTAATGPHLVLLTGEAGIGKTRLAEELLQWADRQGIGTISARCYAAEGELAYAPVTTWLRARPLPSLDPLWLSEVARLLPEILFNQPGLSPPGPLIEAWQRQHLFEALARALLGDSRPLLLLIDDLQWCDRDTLEWLHYLLRFNPHAPLLIVGTLRSEETEVNQSLAPFLLALRHDRQLTELELSSLDQAETVSLATHVAGQELDPILATHLYQETEGNPLFVVETVHAGLFERGLPEQRRDNDTTIPPVTELPPTIYAVIAARLRQLSAPTRELVSLAATIGRAFTFEVLAQASGSDEDTLVCGLDELWQRHIVREQGTEAYDFSHDKIREVAYVGLSAARRRSLHRRVAQALETVRASNLDAVSSQVAAHYEQAGLLEQAIPYYQRAAEVAHRLYANEEAIEHLERALALLEAVSLDKSKEEWQLEAAQLHERLGDILHLTGHYTEARAAFKEALTHVPKRDTIWQARLYHKSGNTWRSEYHYEEALHAYEIAEATLGLEVVEPILKWWQEWIQIQLERMQGYYLLGQWLEIAKLAEKARPTIEQYGTPVQRADFLHSLGIMNMRRDRYVMSEETLTLIQTALAINQESGTLSDIAWCKFGVGYILLWQGDLDGAEEQMLAALELLQRTGDVMYQSRCLTYLTINYRQRSQVEKVKDYISRSLAMATAAHMPENVGVAKANLAWVAWREGNLAEAEAQGRAALKLWEQLALHVYPFHWVALWPLIGIALAQDQVAAVIDYARALLEPTQLRLPDVLTAVVEEAIWAWEQTQPEMARAHLNRAIELAQKMGYL